MGTVRYTNEEIRKRKGRIDHAKVSAATEEKIATWKREDGFEDAVLGPVHVIPPLPDVRATRTARPFTGRVCGAVHARAANGVSMGRPSPRAVRSSARAALCHLDCIHEISLYELSHRFLILCELLLSVAVCSRRMRHFPKNTVG